ncbi:MAG: hypothetical protein HXY28_15300 [Hydrogenophilaceae bacterium]|jgi:hypothetical protein|nr:hypothetical protein [Hydrogenophilaceae bacterium]
MPAKRAAKGGETDAFAALAQHSTANGFLLSQKIALEAARFWARRMRAYADQMEEFARCSSVEDFAGAQQRFVERMRRDYAAETDAFAALLGDAAEQQAKAAADAANGGERPHA